MSIFEKAVEYVSIFAVPKSDPNDGELDVVLQIKCSPEFYDHALIILTELKTRLNDEAKTRVIIH